MKITFQTLLVIILFISCSKDVGPEIIPNYNLKVIVTPTDGGTVAPSDGSYQTGTSVSVLATPSPEYVFKEWNGGVTGTTNPISVTMSSNKNITGVFEKRMYPLSITIEGEGTVTEELLSSKSTKDYPSGSVVKLTAVSVDGWEFIEWNGDYQGTDNSITITVDKKKILTVKFSKKQEMFVSKSPIYSYPNSTATQIITSHYFSGMYINTEYANQHLDSVTPTNNYSFFGRDGVYLDYNNDGYLDFFGFLTNWVSPGVSDNGQYFLINNFFGENPIKKYFDTDIKFLSGMKLNRLDNDSQLEIIVSMSNSHQGFPEELPVRVIDINEDGTLTQRDLSEAMNVHSFTSGDVDNDGDVDILIWLFGHSVITARPYLYLNDGNENFILTDSFQSFDGLQSILENEGPFPITAVELFDLNSDDFLDIICAYSLNDNADTEWDYGLETIRIYWGNGTGEFDLLNNYTDLPNTSITNFSTGHTILGFTFFDYNNDGDYDVVCSGTPNYGGYWIQLYEQTSKGIFNDITTSVFDKWFDYTSGTLDQYGYSTGVDGDFPNFYNLRIYDKNGDGLYDIVPDNLATWDGYQYVSNLYWENVGGSFIRKKENY